MNELARHLAQEGSHAALPFHAGCPACRAERLAGHVATPQVVPARARAGLAAAVLAASTVPATALANPPATEVEPDAEAEGGADPGAQGPAGTELPAGIDDPVTPAVEDPAAGALDEGEGPVEGDGAAEADPVEAPVPRGPRDGEAGEIPADALPVTDPATPVDQPASPTAGEPAADAVKPRKHGGTSTRTERRGAKAAPQTEISNVVQPVVTAPVSQGGTAPASATEDIHVVQPGESLWSIASDLLGPGARSAEIAREVQRIWNLNADSIGTGDPDLVIAGQKLRLR